MQTTRFVRLIIWQKDPASGAESIHDVLELGSGGGRAATIYDRAELRPDRRLDPTLRAEVHFYEGERQGDVTREGLTMPVSFAVPPRCRVPRLCVNYYDQVLDMSFVDRFLAGREPFPGERGET